MFSNIRGRKFSEHVFTLTLPSPSGRGLGRGKKCQIEITKRRNPLIMSDRLLVNVFNVDAALTVARARELFAADGLDVELLVTPNSTDQMRGLSKGSWQIVSTAFDNVLGWSGREGAEIVAIAQVSQGIPLPVYVRPEIKSWDDLRGKKLAVDAVDTAYALVLRRIILEHGLDFDRGDYELVPLGTTGARLESMTRGWAQALRGSPRGIA
jgi:ABC-type nitrate/sulfonate/bicarbonate transport system substrate-binding protein